VKKNSYHNYVLLACVLLLIALCCWSVSSPLRFDHERESREMAVKARLLEIRRAAETYKASHGHYAASLYELVQAGCLADSLRLIPYAEGDTFAISVTTLSSKTDRPVPVMECKAEFAQYLKGMDEDMVSELITEAIDAGAYPGLKIGDMEYDNHNAGNWE